MTIEIWTLIGVYLNFATMLGLVAWSVLTPEGKTQKQDPEHMGKIRED